ncbi:MAG: spermidine synthase, partial [Pseudomonadales bacterium]
MSLIFQELDNQKTSLGEISLRRRRLPAMGDRDIYEVKLGDEFLMSSLFVEGELALARLGLEALSGKNLSVIVGGLGLGYTAAAVLESERVASLGVVEFLQPVINWHKSGLVPVGEKLCADARCRFLQGDFFALAMRDDCDFDGGQSLVEHDAILLDIDHAPDNYLDDQNSSFYTEQGFQRLRAHLRDEGVFAIWSNDRRDERFLELLGRVFRDPVAHEVEFANPLQNSTAINTVYV